MATESAKTILSRISFVSSLLGFDHCDKLDAKIEWAEQRLTKEERQELHECLARVNLNLLLDRHYDPRLHTTARGKRKAEQNRELALIRCLDIFMKAKEGNYGNNI